MPSVQRERKLLFCVRSHTRPQTADRAASFVPSLARVPGVSGALRIGSPACAASPGVAALHQKRFASTALRSWKLKEIKRKRKYSAHRESRALGRESSRTKTKQRALEQRESSEDEEKQKEEKNQKRCSIARKKEKSIGVIFLRTDQIY
jgi:hypothetical protein